MTKIEWTDETWNPITGCSAISEGCENCYAKRMANRLKGRYGYPADEPFSPMAHPDKLKQPEKWKKPRKIFVCSMGDIFHEDYKSCWVQDIWDEMNYNQQHIYIILTKRPQRAFKHKSWWFPNIWLGVTAENQKRADERIPILLQIPAAVHFVSVEPMLGPVNIRKFTADYYHIDDSRETFRQFGTNWVICGAETGPGARPMDPEWAENIWEQCQDAGILFFFKKESKGLPVPDYVRNTREFPSGPTEPK